MLQSVGKRYDGVIEIAYSGGKDSDVILQLAKEAGIKYEAIYKNTTIDPPGTIAHAKAMGATIIRPQLSFFQLVAKKGLPSRFRRFCCEKLKEYKVYDKAVIGVRKAESKARNDRYNEPTQCRWFGAKTETNHVEQIMPILDWTDDDVLAFIQDRNIPLAPVYYDRGGQIDVARRLGCMCCPLKSHGKRLQEFKERQKMVRAYIRAAQKYLDTHKETKSGIMYANAYEWFARDVLFDNTQKWNEANNGLFGKPDWKKELERIFNIDLTM